MQGPPRRPTQVRCDHRRGDVTRNRHGAGGRVPPTGVGRRRVPRFPHPTRAHAREVLNLWNSVDHARSHGGGLCHGRSGLVAMALLSLPNTDSAPGRLLMSRAWELARPRIGWWTPPGAMNGRAGILLASLAVGGLSYAIEALALCLGVPRRRSEVLGFQHSSDAPCQAADAH